MLLTANMYQKLVYSKISLKLKSEILNKWYY